MVRPLLAWAARVSLKRLAPGQPPLLLQEWPGCQFSFSQFGEDRILHQLVRHVRPPEPMTYVDVGAHDPVIFSNTLLLHKMGWTGINIDANPAAIERFRTLRPDDHNLCAAISDCEREVCFYEYPSPAANRIGTAAETGPNVLGEFPLRVTRVATRTLNVVLKEHLREGQRIGFLNVDCEGEDLAILSHLDWDRWLPGIVAAEAHSDGVQTSLVALLEPRGYRLVAKMQLTLLFQLDATHAGKKS